MAFLLIHGLEGSGPEHWQSWLAPRLSARGLHVAYPSLPDADSPRLERWLDALVAELARLPAAETTVLCHSLGSLLWLHHAALRSSQQVARALLVAPPQPDDEDTASIGFRPVPLDREGVAAAARETRLVCSTNDPWCPPETSRRIGEAGRPDRLDRERRSHQHRCRLRAVAGRRSVGARRAGAAGRHGLTSAHFTTR